MVLTKTHNESLLYIYMVLIYIIVAPTGGDGSTVPLYYSHFTACDRVTSSLT